VGSTAPGQRLLALALLAAGIVALSAGAQPSAAPHLAVAPLRGRVAPGSTGRPGLHVVALGDSVPAGSGCDCTPFPVRYARSLATKLGHTAGINNDAAPGLTSGGLLATLGTGQPAAQDVASADIVLITIGANDFDPAHADASCPGGAVGCYDNQLAELSHQLDSILARLAVLRHDAPTAVLLTGYWDIWEDGQVAAGAGAPYVTTGDELTRQVNQRLRQAASTGSATYVDLVKPFRGSSGRDDDTGLLAGDGDHPNDAGHQAIAGALLEATPVAATRPRTNTPGG